jgi:hypothetical protein
MDNHIQHIGIMGMHWGQRKSESPGSPSHERAMANRNPFRTSLKNYGASRKRLNLEKTYEKVQKRTSGANKTLAKSMTDTQIKEFLKNPIMKVTVKQIQRDELERRNAKIVGAMVVGYSAWALSPVLSVGAKYVLTKAVEAKRAGQVVKVAKDVYDMGWK